jgi:hypothetical protein
MKMNFFSLLVGFILLSCSDSDDAYTITDWGGLSVVLSWDDPGKRNNEGIGLILYDPEGILTYGGYDSLTIFHHLKDGRFKCEVEIHSALDKTDYKIQVQGVTGKTIYTFKNSFKLSDPVGLVKPALFITKHKEHYTITTP